MDPVKSEDLEYRYAYCHLMMEGFQKQTRIRSCSLKTLSNTNNSGIMTKLNVFWNESDFVL